MMVTADLHIGDSHLARRGFNGSAGEMAEYVLGIWNRDVADGEHVYVLGDFITDIGWVSIVARMAGVIHLVRGNHDTPHVMTELHKLGVDILGHVHEVQVDGARVILTHKVTEQTVGSDGLTPVTLHGHGHNNRKGDVGIWTWDKIVPIQEAVAWSVTS